MRRGEGRGCLDAVEEEYLISGGYQEDTVGMLEWKQNTVGGRDEPCAGFRLCYLLLWLAV